MPQRNLAVELLQKLLNDEVKARGHRSLVQSRKFSEMLEAAIRRYKVRAITTAQVIEELIALAEEMRAAQQRGEELGLSDEELAFYDALETNDSAVAVLGDEVLRAIARELTETVRRNATIDWTQKQSVQAGMRVAVKRILRKNGYPPDKEKKATEMVLEQAVQLGFEFAEEAPGAAAAPAGAEVAPFRVLEGDHMRPFDNCLPLFGLEAAAGGFSHAQAPEAEAWVVPGGRVRPGPGLFIAKVVGESMNRRIPNGAYCVFKHPVEGSRRGKVVLVQHRDIADPETGGTYTVKIYESAKVVDQNGVVTRARVTLKPDSLDPAFEPIRLRDVADDEVAVIAEVVEILPSGPNT